MAFSSSSPDRPLLQNSLPSPLSPYSACEISDALISLNKPNGGHIPTIHRLTTNYSGAREDKICGRAFTVRMEMVSGKGGKEEDDVGEMKEKEMGHWIDRVGKGEVVCVWSPPETPSASIGGLLSAGAISRGSIGALLLGSGRCRDLDEQNSLQFPIFGHGSTTLGQKGYVRVVEVGGKLRIPSTEGKNIEGLEIERGDWIVADQDGVVIVPDGMVEEVVKKAQKGKEVDEKCMEDIKKGLGVGESFKRHRGK